MTKNPTIRGGRNIAMKVPPHQFAATVQAYRSLGLPILHEGDTLVTFEYGPIKLHIDSRESFSQSEMWLEFVTDDVRSAETSMSDAGFERRDEIENLRGHKGFWVSSPASIIHLVSAIEDE